MRLFLHLQGFSEAQIVGMRRIKGLKKAEQKDNDVIVYFLVSPLSTTNQLIQFIAEELSTKEEDMAINIVIKHQTTYKKLKVVKGFGLNIYARIPFDLVSTLKYQIECEVIKVSSKSEEKKEQLKGEEKTTIEQSNKEKEQQLFEQEQIYRYSKILFQFIKKDQLGQFSSLIDLLTVKFNASQLTILLNLFELEGGYTLLLYCILHNKNDFLDVIIKGYSQFIDFNLRSVDGWLPAQLSLEVHNKKALDLIVDSYQAINLDFNCSSVHGQIVFNLIDTVNIELIAKIVKKFPIRFEDIHEKQRVNAYEYVWNHHRLTEGQKKKLLAFMHEKHIQHYDFYRWDQILFTTCQKYVPQATRTISPRKQVLYNPNLKIISGQIIKCRNTAFFSKYVFLSVNSYIGALEEYEINNKLRHVNDKQKLQKYDKELHLSFEEIQSVYLMEQKDKSWLLKKQWYCFVVKEKRDNKLVFACCHQYTANQWIDEIKQAIKAWSKNPQKSTSNGAKTYVHISDVEYTPPETPRAKYGANKMIQFFSTRLSLRQSEAQTHESSISKKQLQAMKSKSYNTLDAQASSMGLLKETTSLKYQDFRFIQILGEGSFGQVYLVECLRNKKMYALKLFQKKKIILSKQTRFVIAQVNILKQINHPFIISLYFTFQTPNFIYLGLQYCQGKDLSKHLNQQMAFQDADVKIYAAEIVLAIEYLHSMGIIYRDLKPENIMLGKDGHVLLVDFGLSKKTQNNFAKTFCGSPAYLSPEMLDRQGVGPQSDYFSLGVVIFELLFGEPPFYADNIHLLYENIQNGAIKFPRRTDEVTQDFILKLLEKDPKNRLGSRSIEDIKNHAYFSGIDWVKLYKKQIVAPKRDLPCSGEELQDQSQLINMFHDDFDYSEQNRKINRFKNFSFTREQQFS